MLISNGGGGLVIATELQADKAAAAQRNFVDAGVDDLIDLRVGDALTTLREVPDAVDLDFGSDVHGPLLAHLGDRAGGYLSIKLPIGDGIEACVRL